MVMVMPCAYPEIAKNARTMNIPLGTREEFNL